MEKRISAGDRVAIGFGSVVECTRNYDFSRNFPSESYTVLLDNGGIARVEKSGIDLVLEHARPDVPGPVNQKNEPKRLVCANCHYWETPPDGNVGYCHCKSPAVIMGFPTTKADEWCGEFKQREE